MNILAVIKRSDNTCLVFSEWKHDLDGKPTEWAIHTTTEKSLNSIKDTSPLMWGFYSRDLEKATKEFSKRVENILING